MKISLSCFECQTNEDNKNIEKYSVEIRDDNIYSIKCEYGHESLIFLEAHRFELLFEMGIKAMLDGYYREAVSNFAASIERFHEFSIEVFVQNFNYKENPVNVWITETNEYDKSWKIISKQSERQLGAYTMLYLSTFKVTPELMKQKRVEFRNNVIHKGYFPTKLETFDYAKDVFIYLQSKIVELKENMSDFVEYVYDKKMRDHISVEDVNGKYLVKWGEYITFRSLRPIDEIKKLNFDNVIEDRKSGFSPFEK